MRFVARELREHMARLGVRTVDQLVGRTDLLRVRKPAVNQRQGHGGLVRHSGQCLRRLAKDPL